MKYRKCPRCGLNWISQTDEYCKVCIDELRGVKSIFDEDTEPQICPVCNVSPLVGDEPVCRRCRMREKS